MQPSRRHCLYASLAAAALLCLAPRTLAETLTITTSPPGATLELDGIVVGIAPYHVDYPGSYFHKPHTAFGARLEHSMVLRVTKDGYASQQVTISSGPYEWVGLTGKHHGNYFLLKSEHFDIKLEPAPPKPETEEAGSRAGPIKPRPVTLPNTESATEAGTVAVNSDLPGAEIYVDGKFVGQTPSTLRLSAGLHHVEVKCTGKQSWQRDLEVLKDSQLTLSAVLEPQG